MRGSRKVLQITACLAAFLSAQPHALCADTKRSFYIDNWARTPLIEPAPEKPEREPMLGEEVPEAVTEAAQKILEKYGKPEEEFPVTAQENAPKPYKAMLEALNAKEDDLAFQYARQWVRYMRNLSDTTMRVVGITGHAMEREGMLPENGWQSSAEFGRDRELLERDLSRDTKVREEAYRASLPPEVRALLKRAEAAEDGGNLKSEFTQDVRSEDDERTEVRRKMAGRVPVDRLGEVDVYLFFRPNHTRSQMMLTDFDSWSKELGGNNKVRLRAMALGRFSSADESRLKQLLKVDIPIDPAGTLPEQLKVTVFPTTVLISRNSGQAVVEEGYRSRAHVDELVKLMQGGR